MGQGWRWWLASKRDNTGGAVLMWRDADGISKCKVRKLKTPDHTAFQVAAMGWVKSELVRFLGVGTDARKRLRFVVHAAGWLHSMVLHGSTVVDELPQTPEVDVRSARAVCGRRTS